MKTKTVVKGLCLGFLTAGTFYAAQVDRSPLQMAKLLTTEGKRVLFGRVIKGMDELLAEQLKHRSMCSYADPGARCAVRQFDLDGRKMTLFVGDKKIGVVPFSVDVAPNGYFGQTMPRDKALTEFRDTYDQLTKVAGKAVMGKMYPDTRIEVTNMDDSYSYTMPLGRGETLVEKAGSLWAGLNYR